MSTPSKTNYFGSKVVPTESNQISEISTSADVERLFSTASEILNKRRNRLLPNNAEQLLFVHENIANVNYKW